MANQDTLNDIKTALDTIVTELQGVTIIKPEMLDFTGVQASVASVKTAADAIVAAAAPTA